MKILITGVNGYIGKSLYNSLKDKHNVVGVNRNDFDLTKSREVNNFFDQGCYDTIIHCAIKGGSRLKQDHWDIMDDNLKMYYNLLANKSCFSKFIHFGSGAELYNKEEPYGYSKNTIRKSILEKNHFYNLKIFAIFDENELDTRFIKANIIRYINKEPIQIHQDKYMSFFYMKDLIKTVEYYIQNDNLQKELNCVYNHVYTLTAIANIINSLDNYQVKIIQNIPNMGEGYYGENLWRPNIDYLGLEQGIKEVYNKLK